MKLAIFTHVEHQHLKGEFFAYPPYVREMNIWLKKVEQAEVVAPLSEDQQLKTGMAYRHPDLKFTRIPSFDLLSFRAILSALIKIPIVTGKVLGAMHRADHLHLRCPGNIGLLACILQVFIPGKSKSAKYAGNWDPEAQQPWTYKLQRWLLSNTFLTRNMTVLVYGEWPGQSENVKPFFTASFSEEVILKVQEKEFGAPYQFIFVGNLVPGKGLKMALNVIQRLQEKGVDCTLEIYGDGQERRAMEAYVQKAEIKGVEFKGNRSLEELESAYQKAHFVILPSKSEGWPKAVAEGMFFGCVPVVTPVSCVPWMLGNGSRGILLEDRGQRTEDKDLERNVERILEVLGDEERMQGMSKAAREWSQQYTLERFEEGVREVLGKGFPADFRRFSR